MKSLYIILIATLCSFFFSGCGVAMKMQPVNDANDRSVQYKINVAKVDKIVSIKPSNKNDNTIDKQGRPGVTWTTVITQDFTNSVSTDFLGQYFKNVVISNNEEFLSFKFDITKIKMIKLGNQPKYDIEYQVSVFKDARLILEKTYKGKIKAPFMIESKYGFSPIEGTELFAEKAIQKGYFNLLEEQFKPDLLKALKENI